MSQRQAETTQYDFSGLNLEKARQLYNQIRQWALNPSDLHQVNAVLEEFLQAVATQPQLEPVNAALQQYVAGRQSFEPDNQEPRSDAVTSTL